MTIENYKWIPGQGPDVAALRRMRSHFLKPGVPMGEAWFISETRFLWTGLVDQPLAHFPVEEWENVLWDISGTGNFGHLEEWDLWFRFLLPELIEQGNTHPQLFENLLNAFFNIFDQGITEEYPGFRSDVFNTLPLYLMRPEYWINEEDEISKQPLKQALFLKHPSFHHNWNCREVHGEFSAAIFFCLRYLTPEEMTTWVKSLTEIQDTYWRGQLLIWLVGFMELVSNLSITPRKFEKNVPQLEWHYSFLSRAWENGTEFLSSKNIAAFLAEIRARISPEVVLQWVDDFSRNSSLANQLFDIPDLYFDKIFSQQS